MSQKHRRRVYFDLRVWLGCATMALLAASVPARAGRAPGCGDIIVADVTLESDLSCSGAGLIVGADGVEVNLNGHTIAGSGAGLGIEIVGRARVTVRNGTIRSFFTGIRTMSSTDIDIKEMTFTGNVDGVDLQSGSERISIKASAFETSSSRGVMMRGSTFDIEVKSNTFESNRVGILLFAVVGATVKENVVSGSLLAGIRLNFQTANNLLAENTLFSNPTGIDFIAGPSGGSTGNSLRENQLLSNGCGLRGPLGGNTLNENIFAGNTTDVRGS